MDVLRIRLDLGPRAHPAQLEQLVRAVRVASDVGSASALSSRRRVVNERMRRPSDEHLREAAFRLERQDGGIAARAFQFLDARSALRRSSDVENFGLLYAFIDEDADYFLNLNPEDPRWLDTSARPQRSRVRGPNLEQWDPRLYRALVADALAQIPIEPVFVRSLDYRNPFGEEIAAMGAGADALGKTAGVVRTLLTIGSQRRIEKAKADKAEAEARVAAAKVPDDIMRSRIELAKAEQELLAMRIENAAKFSALPASGQKKVIVEHLTASGSIDEAEAAHELDPADASALLSLGVLGAEVEEYTTADPDDERLT